eukprot:NODE_341_length_9178_cov_1.080846.p9 type:complete len:153 gc:universal NODE_341_length_9178_cov_1.080846:942-484(-)
MSTEKLGDLLLALPFDAIEFKNQIKQYLSLDLADEQSSELKQAYDRSKLEKTRYAFMQYLSKLINTKAEIGATTHGHTAVDVPLITFGQENWQFTSNRIIRGIMENTQLSFILWREYMGFSFEKVKNLIKDQNINDPFGRIPIPEKRSCQHD